MKSNAEPATERTYLLIARIAHFYENEEMRREESILYRD